MGRKGTPLRRFSVSGNILLVTVLNQEGMLNQADFILRACSELTFAKVKLFLFISYILFSLFYVTDFAPPLVRIWTTPVSIIEPPPVTLNNYSASE